MNEYLGTAGYASPQIINNKPYDGFKNDIFCLGQTLIILVTGNIGFSNTNDGEKFYRYIKYRNEYYWTYLKKKLELIIYLQNLKNYILTYFLIQKKKDQK